MAKKETSREPKGTWNFARTRWSVVLAAGQGAQEALATLCAIYWYPIYAFFRRSRGAEDALDLTQGFFAWLLEKNAVAVADPERGKFRNWLLKAATNYLINDARRARTKKRGSGIAHVPFDLTDAEERYRLEPAHDITPERMFERRWALTLLAQVFDRLRDEYVKRDQAQLFDKLRSCLIGENDQKQRDIAEQLGMEDENFRQHVHRCKNRYGELFEEEIAQIVSTDDEIEEEKRFIREALQSR